MVMQFDSCSSNDIIMSCFQNISTLNEIMFFVLKNLKHLNAYHHGIVNHRAKQSMSRKMCGVVLRLTSN